MLFENVRNFFFKKKNPILEHRKEETAVVITVYHTDTDQFIFGEKYFRNLHFFVFFIG